jgi:hypothetical protein
MPSGARGLAVALLAKANGNAEVAEGFERLATDENFKGLSAKAKRRIFSIMDASRQSTTRRSPTTRSPRCSPRSSRIDQCRCRASLTAWHRIVHSRQPAPLVSCAPVRVRAACVLVLLTRSRNFWVKARQQSQTQTRRILPAAISS